MASIGTVVILVAFMIVLTPGMIVSVPPGPNKLWLFGGQVTWTNMIVHAILFGLAVYYFIQ